MAEPMPYLERKASELAALRWPEDARGGLVLVDLDYDGTPSSWHFGGKRLDAAACPSAVFSKARIERDVPPGSSERRRLCGADGFPVGAEVWAAPISDGVFDHGVVYFWEVPDCAEACPLSAWIDAVFARRVNPLEILRRRQDWLRRRFDEVYERGIRPLMELGQREASQLASQQRDPRKLGSRLIDDIPELFACGDVYQRIAWVLHRWFGVRRAAFVVEPGIGPWKEPPPDTRAIWQYSFSGEFPGGAKATHALVRMPAAPAPEALAAPRPAGQRAGPDLLSIHDGLSRIQELRGRIGTGYPVPIARAALGAWWDYRFPVHTAMPYSGVDAESAPPFEPDQAQDFCTADPSGALHVRLEILDPLTAVADQVYGVVVRLPDLDGVVLLERDPSANIRFPPWLPGSRAEFSWRLVRFVLHRLLQTVLDQRAVTVNNTRRALNRLDELERRHKSETAPAAVPFIDIRTRLRWVHETLARSLDPEGDRGGTLSGLVTPLNLVYGAGRAGEGTPLISPAIFPDGDTRFRSLSVERQWILVGPGLAAGLFRSVVRSRAPRVILTSDDNEYTDEERVPSKRYHLEQLRVPHFVVFPVFDPQERIIALLSVGQQEMDLREIGRLHHRNLHLVHAVATWLGERLSAERRDALRGARWKPDDPGAALRQGVREPIFGIPEAQPERPVRTGPVGRALLTLEIGCRSCDLRVSSSEGGAGVDAWREFLSTGRVSPEDVDHLKGDGLRIPTWKSLTLREFFGSDHKLDWLLEWKPRVVSKECVRGLWRSLRLVNATLDDRGDVEQWIRGWVSGESAIERPSLTAPVPLKIGRARPQGASDPLLWALPRPDALLLCRIGAPAGPTARALAVVTGALWEPARIEPPSSCIWIPHGHDPFQLATRLAHVLSPLPVRGAPGDASRSAHGSYTLDEWKRLGILDGGFPILFLGPPGSGKTTLAGKAHQLSVRRDAPFRIVDAAATRAEDLRMALFGVAKGAFTNVLGRSGILDAINGGTILIDEIGVLDEMTQAALMRLIVTGLYSPVGSTEEKQARVVVYAATNAPTNLRPDLRSRFKVVYKLPGLKHRLDAYLVLKEHLADRHEASFMVEKDLFDAWVLDTDWTAHFRELLDLADFAALNSRQRDGTVRPQVTLADLDWARDWVRRNTADEPEPPPGTAANRQEGIRSLADLLSDDCDFRGRDAAVRRLLGIEHGSRITALKGRLREGREPLLTQTESEGLGRVLAACSIYAPREPNELKLLLDRLIDERAPGGGR